MLRGKGFWIGLMVGVSAVLVWGYYLLKQAEKPAQ